MEKGKSKSKSKSKGKDGDGEKTSRKSIPKKKSKASLKIEVNNNEEENINTPIINTTEPINEQINQQSIINNTDPNINYNQIQSQNNINTLNSNNNNNYPNQNYIPHEKCDGCFENDAIIFCNNCNQLYCKNCDNLIHTIPSNSNHDKKLLNESFHIKKFCRHHNSLLKYYCETCEELICQECQMLGPHNSKLHKIINIYECFNKKYNYLNNLVHNYINNKYNDYLNQLDYINYLNDEVRNYRNNIERGIRNYYTEMIDNLNLIEGNKLSIINYDSTNLQKDINIIEEIINYLNDYNNNENNDIISFLNNYNQNLNKINYILSKPIKKNIEINLNDFPNEEEENNIKFEEYDKLEELIKLKDEIIYKMITDNKYDKPPNALNEKTKSEITELAKLSDKYASELQKYNLICDFCGCYLDENVVNSTCEKNIESEIDYNNYFFYSNILPPEDFIGNGRHYFVSPSNDENNIKNDNNININNNNENNFNNINIDKINFIKDKEIEFNENNLNDNKINLNDNNNEINLNENNNYNFEDNKNDSNLNKNEEVKEEN